MPEGHAVRVRWALLATVAVGCGPTAAREFAGRYAVSNATAVGRQLGRYGIAYEEIEGIAEWDHDTLALELEMSRRHTLVPEGVPATLAEFWLDPWSCSASYTFVPQ